MNIKPTQINSSQIQEPQKTQTNSQVIQQNVMPGTVIESTNIFAEQVFQHIKNNEISHLQTLLSSEGPRVHLLDMFDVKHFTVLSFAAYKNTEECFVLLFNHALENNLSHLHDQSFE